MSEISIENLSFGDVGELSTPRGNVRFLKAGLGQWRWETIMTKEPETIEWIDSFSANDSMWDIGANVGIYSIYAALAGHKVMAFEPHFANYFQLCVNIFLNGLQDRVKPICMAFGARRQLSTINLAELKFGSALSTFDGDLDCRGNKYNIAFRQGMLGYDLDTFVKDMNIDIPHHVKIDVDGLELDIVRGGESFFSSEKIKSLSVELIDTDPVQVNGVHEIMVGAGMHFVHKKQDPQWNNDILNFLYKRHIEG